MNTSVELIPMQQIADKAWAWLTAGANVREHPARLVTLASLTPRGQPDARLLVVRGCQRSSGCLWFYSDARAGKIAQLEQAPDVCCVSYDAVNGVQLRLYGKVAIRVGDETARRHWEQIDLATRYEYRVSDAPGKPLPRRDPVRHRHARAMDDDEAGFEHFAVMELTIDLIDWLQVTSLGDRRATLRRINAWRVDPIVP